MVSPYTDLDRPPLREAALRRALRVPDGFVSDLRVVTEVDSTNADLRDQALAGAPAGSVLVAEYQRAGRGRLDRGWTSPPRAGLTFSVLLHPPATVPARRWPWLPLLTGCAVVEALRSAADLQTAGLKWPNNVVVDDRKVCGILLERVETPTGPAAVVGIGLNVTTTTAELPSPQATSLKLAGASTTDRSTLLIAVLRAVEALHTAWYDAGGDPDVGHGGGLRAAYRARCTTIGRDVRVQLGPGQPVPANPVPASRSRGVPPTSTPRGGWSSARRLETGPSARATSSTCADPASSGMMRLTFADKGASMGISAKLLGDDERLVMSMRTHWKIMIGPLLLLLATVAAAVVAVVLIPVGEYQQWIRLALIAIALIGALIYAIWPILNWVASAYAVTDRRLITRHGVITRTGRDIPLTRVNDVSSERGLLDRILGCGTLVIWSAGEQGKVVLPDVPRVEVVQRTISELVFAREEDDDETPERKTRVR